MKFFRTLLIAGMLALASGTAGAEVPEPNEQNVVRIQFSPGGSVFAFITRIMAVQNAGARVIIDGPCISACTLVVAMVDASRVCATPRAYLAFHSAAQGELGFTEAAREITRVIWFWYPAALRTWLLSQGWDGNGTTAHPNLIFLHGEDLHRFVRPCATEEA